MALRRRYKIQDVIQRRQVLLVQVVKEERGNKGAALTSYLSLAGRYTVLMPNSSHGGRDQPQEISSTKRSQALERHGLPISNLPRSMGLIVRTPPAFRGAPNPRSSAISITSARVWDEIREKTLASVAPALIPFRTAILIKRAIPPTSTTADIEEVDGGKARKAINPPRRS